jgi:hypothetical protein
MASTHVTHVLCAGAPRGSGEAIDRLTLLAREHEAQALALVGDLGGGAVGIHAVLSALGRAQLPTYWVPGPGDAPVGDYLREAYNAEVVHPLLHGVHGTAALATSAVIFAGFGGEVSDDPDAPRDEIARLSYPRWEPEYRLKLLREWPEHQLVMLFGDHPAHKGLGKPGSEALAELIGTFRPRLVVCGGARGVETIGRSVVVAPGSLADGEYALADLRHHRAELHELALA